VSAEQSAQAGSASLWVIGFGLVGVLAAVVGVSTGSAVLARHRTEAIADVSALAAAGRIGVDGDPCAAARRIATENGARVAACRLLLDPSGRSGKVTITLTRQVKLPVIGPQSVRARAAAERLPPASAL
jgi:secretion/DNA translocation related TadE-like protein